MRCGVGAEEGAAEAAGDQLPQSLLMNIAFKYRQTVQVRANAATSIWLRLNIRCCGVMVAASSSLPSRTYSAASLVVICSKPLSGRAGAGAGLHHRLNKARFTIENINLGVSDFAVNEQRHPQFFHPLQHWHNGVGAGDAGLELVVALAGRAWRR